MLFLLQSIVLRWDSFNALCNSLGIQGMSVITQIFVESLLVFTWYRSFIILVLLSPKMSKPQYRTLIFFSYRSNPPTPRTLTKQTLHLSLPLSHPYTYIIYIQTTTKIPLLRIGPPHLQFFHGHFCLMDIFLFC